MKIEDITAPPPRLSPEMRYASLHRSVEGGLATDRSWSELVEVCIQLGFKEEAQTAFWHVKDASVRRRLLVELQRHHLLLDVSLGAVESGQESPSGGRSSHSVEGIVDRMLDGFRFLFSDHMPLTAIVATVTFPVVVGLGGFLTSTVQSSLLLPLLALLPALSVVGLVGALGRRILVEAAQGLDDPPEIPAAGALVRDAGRFLIDATVLCAIFLGPGAALTQVVVHVGWSGVAAALATGLVFLPMAMALRQTRDDWSCLRPSVLFRSIVRGGLDYMAIVTVSTLLFAPSLLSVWFTGGSHLYLVISVVGPLAVVPTFVVSRLLGQFLFAKRKKLPKKTRAASATPTATVKKTRPAARRPVPPRPTASLRSPTHPEARTVARRKVPGRPAPAQPRPPKAQAGLPPPRLRVRDDASGLHPATQPQRSAQRSRVVGEEIPDLTKMPGFAVLTGDARVTAGAAAPTRPQ